MDMTGKDNMQTLSDEEMDSVTGGGYITYNGGKTVKPADDFPTVCPQCGRGNLFVCGDAIDRYGHRFRSYQCSPCHLSFDYYYS